MDDSGNTNHVMEVTKTTIGMKTEQFWKEFQELQAQAKAMLITQMTMTEAERPWLQKKFLQTLTLCVSIWMIVDMVLDWFSCYRFYLMCQVMLNNNIKYLY